MPEQPSTLPASIATGHELATVHARGVAIFIACFILTMALILTGLYFFFGRTIHHQTLADAAPFPLGFNPPATLPQPLQPSPTHPALPWQDLPLLRNADLQTLHTTGPLPNDPAHQHIPIDTAMHLLLQRAPASHPATTAPWQIPTPDRPATVENRT